MIGRNKIMNIKDRLQSVSSKKLYIILWILIVLTYGYMFLNETKREEDNYIYCKIVKQENNDIQISFPDGKKQWIERKDEEISEDGKYIRLRVIRHFNRINQLKSEELMDVEKIGRASCRERV